MSNISNSASDCTFSTTGLPDELSPAAQAQFAEECNAWHDDRRAVEAEHESDYFEQIAHLRRQNEQIERLLFGVGAGGLRSGMAELRETPIGKRILDDSEWEEMAAKISQIKNILDLKTSSEHDDDTLV